LEEVEGAAMTANQMMKAGLAAAIVLGTFGVVFVVVLKGDTTDKATLGAMLPTVLTCFALVYQSVFKHDDQRQDKSPEQKP
jgi:hypothetical protein